MLRPKMVSGATNDRTAGKQAASTPSGTPTNPLRPNPRQTRRRVTSALATSRRSPNTPGTAAAVSPGLGRVAGLINRLSASPDVAKNHTASTQARQVTPQNITVATAASPRSGLAGRDTGGLAKVEGSDGVVIPVPRHRP